MMRTRWIILAVLSLLPASAFAGPQSLFNAGGPAARNLAQIGWGVYITFWIVCIIMFVLLIWAVVRRTGSLDSHERWDIGGGQGWILIGGLAIPLVILCGMYVLSLSRMTAFPLRNGSPQKVRPEVLVIGHQWWWEVHYLTGPTSEHFATANEIHIPVGRPIDLELQSEDVIHSFWVPALHGKVQLVPGLTNYIRIEANHPGNYRGQCAVYCGEQHAHMRLLVVAQNPADYQAWREDQLKPANQPHTPEAQRGAEVFAQAACALCHTVRGTVANGRVAPDLTHLASRQYIAADSFVNDKADLEAWVTHAQSMKPGCQMPDLTVFNGTDLRALVAYLQQLN